MHTWIDIVLCDKREEEVKRIIQIIVDELYKLEKTCNFYDPSSQFSNLNNNSIKRGISVVTNNATDGEVLSTALFVAEFQERDKILQHFEATIFDL